MRSAIVNDTSFVVENIIVADPVDPSPYTGTIMVGLQDAVYETQINTTTTSYPSGTSVALNSDGSVSLNIPNVGVETFPAGSTVITNEDGTVNVTVITTSQVLVIPPTACDIGWIYNPATGTFSAP